MATQEQLARTALFGGMHSIRSVRDEHSDGSVVEGFLTRVELGPPSVVRLTKHSVMGAEDPHYTLEWARIARVVIRYHDGTTKTFDL